jgi:hypothetical protein
VAEVLRPSDSEALSAEPLHAAATQRARLAETGTVYVASKSCASKSSASKSTNSNSAHAAKVTAASCLRSRYKEATGDQDAC